MDFDVKFSVSDQSFNPQFSESEQTFSARYKGLQIINGKGGENGKSAYELAVQNGFEGSETEWLESLHGKDGYTPIKGVDYFDGTDGVNGLPGYTPVKGVDYFDGKDGADGKTPVKGTDYYTESDKAEMVSAVIAALPVYDGGVELL